MKQECRCTKCRKRFEVEYKKREDVWTVHRRVGDAHRKLSPSCAGRNSLAYVRITAPTGEAVIETPYSRAWLAFFQSDEGERCLEPGILNAQFTSRTFLENRIREAFDAGWNARGAQPQEPRRD